MESALTTGRENFGPFSSKRDATSARTAFYFARAMHRRAEHLTFEELVAFDELQFRIARATTGWFIAIEKLPLPRCVGEITEIGDGSKPEEIP